MNDYTLLEQDFRQIQRLMYQEAGISLTPSKKVLISGRLMKRLRHFGLTTFRDYLHLVDSPQHQEERRLMINLLTTNETSFFREPRHFDFLTELLRGTHLARPWRIWSAACSTGEEPYSIAMTLADALGNHGWELVASDINNQVLDKASQGIYPMARAEQIPQERLMRHCMRGTGQAEGHFMVSPHLRERIAFHRINLIERLPDIGQFDVIFLRNVMIYFDVDTKKRVVDTLTDRLVPGGYLFTGHSESLHGITTQLASVRPAVYRKGT
jgi:chemotaxis protein methyltransferase CheR